MNTPAPKGFAFPPFREQAPAGGAAAGAGASSSPKLQMTEDGKAEFAVRQQPAGISTLGQTSVYTTAKRWRACDVYIDVGSLSIAGVTAATRDSLGVALFATIQGVRTLVATGRFSAVELMIVGLKQKHLIHYVGGIAEKFEVVYWINAVAVNPAVNLAIAVIASDEAVGPPTQNEEEAGTILVGPTGILGANANGVTRETQGPPLECRGIVASSLVALTLATPRWLHVHDLPGGTTAATLNPLFSFSLTSGGGTFTSPDLEAWRFVNGIAARISSTAAVTTEVVPGSEDTAVQRIAFR